MTQLKRYLMAGSVAGTALLIASGAFAATVEEELAQVDQMLAAAPAQTQGQRSTSPVAAATNLRNEAQASLASGDRQAADQQAKLALRELGADGIPFDDQQQALTCIEGCPGRDLPAVSAEQISDGAAPAVRIVPSGQAWRSESAASTEPVNDGSSTLAHNDLSN